MVDRRKVDRTLAGIQARIAGDVDHLVACVDQIIGIADMQEIDPPIRYPLQREKRCLVEMHVQRVDQQTLIGTVGKFEDFDTLVERCKAGKGRKLEIDG